MIRDREKLISGYLEALSKAGLGQPASGISYEHQRAPHRAHRLPGGKCAVYVFSLCDAWGSKCPAGPSFVLKVGKVGPNSNPRFQYQHYSPKSAGSNLAKSLLNSKVLWMHLGITDLVEAQVGNWIKQNTDRDHFYLDVADLVHLGNLERFIRGMLRPALEGG